MNSATIAFRVKPEIKRRADELFARLGMTTSTGMNILLMQTLEYRGFAAPIRVRDAAQPTEEEKRDLSRDIETSRREFAEGKGIPHEQVVRETREMLNSWAAEEKRKAIAV